MFGHVSSPVLNLLPTSCDIAVKHVVGRRFWFGSIICMADLSRTLLEEVLCFIVHPHAMVIECSHAEKEGIAYIVFSFKVIWCDTFAKEIRGQSKHTVVTMSIVTYIILSKNIVTSMMP